MRNLFLLFKPNDTQHSINPAVADCSVAKMLVVIVDLADREVRVDCKVIKLDRQVGCKYLLTSTCSLGFVILYTLHSLYIFIMLDQVLGIHH